MYLFRSASQVAHLSLFSIGRHVRHSDRWNGENSVLRLRVASFGEPYNTGVAIP